MECQTFYNGLTLNPSTDKWTHWFSEETPPPSDIGTTSTDPPMNAGVCQYGIGIDAVIPGVMTGAHCTGKYCDNMQLECDQPVKYNGATPVPSIATNCQTYGPYSEENGSQDFGAGRFVSAISCSGKYCDNLTFTVCSFPAPF
jgi:hypothetical protein